MQKKRVCLLLLSLFAFSCTKTYNSESSNHQLTINTYNDLSFSKTSIDSEDLTSSRWAKGDKIYLWADNSKDEQTLEAQEFSIKFFTDSYSHATFVSSISEAMAEDTYDYYAIYPTPVTHSGKNVTMNISSSQSGTFDGLNDLLIAEPFTAGALGNKPLENTYINFKHVSHAMRISIPENNLGDAINKLIITFPCDVVGDVNFDVDNYDETVALENGSNTITVDMSQGIDVDNGYAWIFINPTTISGDVTFEAFSESGLIAESISTNINETFAQGEITPIKLTVPEVKKLKTTLDFTINSDCLGESVTSVSVTAPDGAEFVGYGNTATITNITDEKFSLTYTYQANDDIDYLTDTLAIVYGSANAEVKGTHKLSNITLDTDNAVSLTTPYLFEETFKTVTYLDSNSTTTNSNPSAASIPGLSGFTGARFKTSASTSVSIVANLYRGGFTGSNNTYRGRMDTGTLSNLRSTASGVKIAVSYDISYSTSKSSPILIFGSTTTTGSIGASTNITNIVEPGKTVSGVTNASSGSFTNIKGSLNYDVSGCSDDTRLSFMVTTTDSFSWGFSAQSALYYIFIDNIKVSITK